MAPDHYPSDENCEANFSHSMPSCYHSHTGCEFDEDAFQMMNLHVCISPEHDHFLHSGWPSELLPAQGYFGNCDIRFLWLLPRRTRPAVQDGAALSESE